ncbi:unnamed protein product [Paramecium sonneborni]|uniref:Uncharacterized protein n=1 Tax=Paramecium sonneborni TaxID=65129 RepID=A0A8S1RMT2_9CILI|nr:unnamed protein product [Paramecium sonneborni]
MHNGINITNQKRHIIQDFIKMRRIDLFMKDFFRFQIISVIKNTYLLTTVNKINLNIIKSDLPYQNYLEKQQQDNLKILNQYLQLIQIILYVGLQKTVVTILFIGGSNYIVILRGDQLKHTSFDVTLMARELQSINLNNNHRNRYQNNQRLQKHTVEYYNLFIFGQQKCYYFRIIILKFFLNQVDQNIQIIQEQDTSSTIEFVLIHQEWKLLFFFINVVDFLLQNSMIQLFQIIIYQFKFTDKDIIYPLNYSTSRRQQIGRR